MSEFLTPHDLGEELDDSLPLRELNRLLGGTCIDCATPYAARDVVFNVALGFANAVRCWQCLPRRLGRNSSELRQQLLEYVNRRECYRLAWQEAVKRDDATLEPVEASETVVVASTSIEADTAWDAGDLGCGELVMALRMRLKNLPPGSVVQVTATDPAAPEDLPAWCRLSGHTLVAMAHPNYFIRRKGD